MLGIGCIPAAIFFLALFLSPESPRFLIQSGREEEGFAILEKIGGTDEARREVADVKASIERDKNGKLTDLFKKPLLIPFLIGLLLAAFNQVGGQNAVSYYGPTMFKAALGNNIPNVEFLCSSLVGLVELIFTVVGMALIDKAGRKPLLVTSAAGMGVFAAMAPSPSPSSLPKPRARPLRRSRPSGPSDPANANPTQQVTRQRNRYGRH